MEDARGAGVPRTPGRRNSLGAPAGPGAPAAEAERAGAVPELGAGGGGRRRVPARGRAHLGLLRFQ